MSGDEFDGMYDDEQHVCTPLCTISDTLEMLSGTAEGKALMVALEVAAMGMSAALLDPNAALGPAAIAKIRSAFPTVMQIVDLFSSIYDDLARSHPEFTFESIAEDAIALNRGGVNITVGEDGDIIVERGGKIAQVEGGE